MRTYKIAEVLAKVKRSGKVPASEYLKEGHFPIIDQSKSLIAGYTNDPNVVIREPLPITVFGDHTRAVKLAKYPFACGADGTQLIFPNTDEIDPTFLFYAISNVDLSNYFYARHFKFLKDQEILVPDLTTQSRIVDILSAYDDLIENNRRRIQLLEESARLLYREWFVRFRFPGHEHVKIIDGVPEGWEKSTVSGLGKIVTGKTPSTKTPENFGGNIPFVKTPDMHRSRVIVETEEFLSERGANTQANKTLPVGSILVACIGARLGVVSITCKPCQTNQQINAVIPSHDHYRYYGLFALIDIKPRLEAMGGGATMPNVNKSKFASIPIFIPSQILLQEFQEFASYTFQQIQLLHQQNVALTQARDFLLPRLMNGEIAL